MNRMQEAMTLFESVANSRWFIKTAIILFLNKIDLFRAKLASSPLSNTFPDYRGGSDYDSATNFLLEKFVGLNQNPNKSIYAVGGEETLLTAALHRRDGHQGISIRCVCCERRDYPAQPPGLRSALGAVVLLSLLQSYVYTGIVLENESAVEETPPCESSELAQPPLDPFGSSLVHPHHPLDPDGTAAALSATVRTRRTL